mgnify:FL=1
MNLRSMRWRRWIMALLTLVVVGIYVARLMSIQIINADQYKKILDGSYISTQVVKATRGEIVDRNGKPLTVNRMGYDIIIDKAWLPTGSQNEILLRLMNLCEELGEEWTDNLPISQQPPYTVLSGREQAMDKLRSFLGIQSYATAEDAMYQLVKRYKLEDFDPIDQRKIAGVRYEMEQRGFAFNVPYTFATDISIESVVHIKERSYELAGVEVVENAIREYVDGTIAPHILGTVGPIYREEYPELKEKGYAMDDIVGKEGVEKAFESVLRGVNGKREIHLESGNVVIKDVESQPPIPGNTVVLSLDADLQRKVQQALENQIKYLQENEPEGEGKEADAGAAVVLDVKTGEVLAMATYPSYNLTTYRQDFASLLSDPRIPLVNRALQGEYAPGSTFKPNTALAALRAGVIDKSTIVNCQQSYLVGNHFFTCLSYHGPTNVIWALTRSCNIYFYDVSRRIGIDAIDSMAKQMGLGEPTGIELPEKTGVRSNPTTKLQKVKEQWYEGDLVQTAIGQLYNQFTPLQLANYAATIANRGKRMKVTVVHEIRDYSMQNVVQSNQPQVVQVVDAPQEAFETVIEGMVAASRPGGTAAATFGYYPIDVASKTGTPETASLPNSTFIAFAPAQDPQIAVAVVIEKGWHGYTGAPVAKAAFDAYFGYDQKAPEPAESPEAGAAENQQEGNLEGEAPSTPQETTVETSAG